MSTAQQGSSQVHEVRDCMCAIADEFLQDACDEGEGFGVVEA